MRFWAAYILFVIFIFIASEWMSANSDWGSTGRGVHEYVIAALWVAGLIFWLYGLAKYHFIIRRKKEDE